MRIRRAEKDDFPQIVQIARKYNLNYQGMEADDYWVAVDGQVVFGICGLRQNPDCLELCSLGVEEAQRGRGWGKKLVQRLLREVPGDIHLATIIPGFFARLGFVRAPLRPLSMVKSEDWCAGCKPELCTVMVRKGPG
jgi:N-acetylglutamate synthase-like GNAT family acetyltransferase